MWKLTFLLFFTSCSLGYIRDIHELDKIKSKREIPSPSVLSGKIRGQFYEWFFDEYEVVLNEDQKIDAVVFPKGSRVFFDTKGSFKRGRFPNGQFVYDKNEVTNDKIKFLFKDNAFMPSDSSKGDYKYSLWPKNFPNEISRSDFLVKANVLFACTGEIEAIAVKDILLNDQTLHQGDVVTLKKNKIWKIKNQVVDSDLNKDLCGFIRTENYKLEY